MRSDHPAGAASEVSASAPGPEGPESQAAAPESPSPDAPQPLPAAADPAAATSLPEAPSLAEATAAAEPTGTAESGAAAASTDTAEADDPDQHRFECRSCGFVYDPAEGVRKLGIDPGTPFSALDPVGFRCPVCRSRIGAFRDIGPRDKPSGFEENLNYGFGVNRLTPGQKNVLIFSGFALAIAFFLSLYSLR